MLGPILVSLVVVVAILILCVIKPNAGRIFLGFFFIAMALGVNGSFTFRNPQAYVDYAHGALIPLYGQIATAVVSVNPTVFGLLLMVFELSMGLLLLHKDRSVKIGLVGTMLFVTGIAPLSWLQVPWLGLIIAEILLFRQTYDKSLIDMIRQKFNKKALENSLNN